MATIGFIGLGNMGAAMIRGLSGSGDIDFVGFDLDRERLNVLCTECSMQACDTPSDVVAKADFIVLCIKPHQVKDLLKTVREILTPEKRILSIAAGVTMKQLGKWSGHTAPVIRVMPNTPALVGAGVFAVCLDDTLLTDDDKSFVVDMLSRVGAVHVLPEKDFDTFTAVAGCGPAYVFYFMEALIEAAVREGLTRDKATAIVLELFKGSTKLADESPLHLSVLREMVCSPAGATIEGVACFDDRAVRAAIVDGVRAARIRSEELGD
ncbi:pyrroline-5-carboxylate reductase [Desulfovibrio inopinatus]|uniref:pyrroline-5-carboxylate reductase n=1 Tax=Desulfovibrio inopinatus TaxID=102109 RepID=UPI00042104C2|nr:pyrroline-5-carboxylate reductase [Desulfovibrio inopinatus]